MIFTQQPNPSVKRACVTGVASPVSRSCAATLYLQRYVLRRTPAI